MEHTPGPWKAEGWKGTVVNDSRGTTIALHPGDSRQYGLAEVQANARLMAAAPDMLNALKELELRTRQYLDGTLITFPCALLGQVRATIAYAEGNG